jgi:DNA adenine methylase
MEKVKPIIRWPGGKTRLLKTILPLMRPHACYAEPFAGGLAVLLAKPPAKVEIVNDLNGDIVNLYRCAQYHLDALVAELRWIVNSRKNLADFMKQPGLTDLQRAARYLVRNRISFGGQGTSYGVSRSSGGAAGSRRAVVESLDAFSRRLDRVSVECVSWERIFALYDGPQTLFFCDPPYMGGETHAYAAWQEPQMRAFAQAVQQLQGEWIVTVNDSPLTRQLFAGHELRPVITASGGANRKSRPGATFAELVIRRRLAPGPTGRRSKALAGAVLA